MIRSKKNVLPRQWPWLNVAALRLLTTYVLRTFIRVVRHTLCTMFLCMSVLHRLRSIWNLFEVFRHWPILFSKPSKCDELLRTSNIYLPIYILHRYYSDRVQHLLRHFYYTTMQKLCEFEALYRPEIQCKCHKGNP